MLKGNFPLPWGGFDVGDTYRKNWQHVQLLTSQFWKRWTCEYLPELQRRHKWQNVKPNIQVGDLVLVMDESMPRGCWPLGLVTETNVGRDDLIRSVKVKTKSTIMTRPITMIVLLEGVK